MTSAKQKFSSQASTPLLKALRKLAKEEGRQLHSLIDEAFQDLIEKRRGSHPRKEVMAAYEKSLEEFDSLYRRLAK